MELTYCEPQTWLSPPLNANPTLAKGDVKMGQFRNLKLLCDSLDSLIFTPPKLTYTSPATTQSTM